MKFKGISLKVPRRDVDYFVDVFTLNGYVCDVERFDDVEHPFVVRVCVPEHDVFDWQGSICELCGGFDGEHEEGCDGSCPDCGVVHADGEDEPDDVPKDKGNN